MSLQGQKAAGIPSPLQDNISRVIIGVILALAMLAIAGVPVFGSTVAFGETQPLAELVWVLPVVQSFVILSALAIAFLCLGRYLSLGGDWVYWAGALFLANAIMGTFYLMSWPGLLGNRGLIAQLSNTASWFFYMTFSSLALLLLIVNVRPKERAEPSSRVYFVYLAVGGLSVLVGALSLLMEGALPSFVVGLVFTPLSLILDYVLMILFAIAAASAYRRYRREQDSMLGYLALFLVLMAFALLYFNLGGKRYDVWWYGARTVTAVSYLVLLFGLLQEGYSLFSRERVRADERARLLKEVSAQRRLFEAVVDNAPAGIAVLRGPNFIYELVNPIYQAIAPGKKFLGRSVAEAWPELASDILPILEDVFRTGEVYHAVDTPRPVERMPGAPLEEVFFTFSYVPLPRPQDEEGKILVLVHETTEQVRAHRRIEELAQAAERRAGEMETIVESIADAVFVCDSAGRITLVNRAGLALVGEEKGGALGTLTDYLAHLQLRFPDGRPVPLEDLVITRALRGEVSRGREETGIHPETHRRLDLLISAAPLKDESGRVVGAVEVAADITPVRELTEEAQRRAAELDAANKELESFSYSVSHDLRAPLRHIDGFSKILLEEYTDKLDEQGQEYLQFAREGSQRMGQLIDDLLKISRVTRAEMHRESVDLSEMAQSIAAELRQEQPERQVEFVIEPGVVSGGDPILLQLVLQNLLGNAWKFTSKRPLARVEFGVARQDHKPVYYVRDNGAGFDQAYAGKLFGAFQRLHSEAEFPGTGIGLATVQRIIHRHGGRVWAEGAVDRGATFYFTLE